MTMGGGFTLFVSLLDGLFCDSRVLARYSDLGLRIARVVLFQIYCGLGGSHYPLVRYMLG